MKEIYDAKKIKPIGISLSGGGSRAAAFHFGVLAYLEQVGLLSNLTMLSTVSGGSFTGVKYALSLSEKVPFDEFFKKYYHELESIELVKLGLDCLAEGKLSPPSGRKDMIIAFAQVYANTFLKNKNGEPALFESILNADNKLQEVVFNTTEFRNGLDFRFQKSNNPKARIGNAKISIPPKAAAKIRLADIVAASSCVPGGFEPMAFPDDFIWPNEIIPSVIREKLAIDDQSRPVALMDGGIYDNQGITSLMLADKRGTDKLEMIIISDVSQESDDFLPFPNETTKGILTLNHINIVSLVIAVVCALTVMDVGYKIGVEIADNRFKFFWDFFLYLIPILLAGTTAGSIFWVRKFIRSNIFPNIPQVGKAVWDDLKHLKVNQVADMIKMRMDSLFALTNSVFMNRIRSLVYDLLFKNENYEGKRISNFIYHLKSNKEFYKKLDNMEDIAKPSMALYEVTDIAANMPTELWFDADYKLPCLVASGQATICYNLMKYIVRVYGEKTSSYPDEIRGFWERLKDDWNKFVEDPYILLQKQLSCKDLPRPNSFSS